MLNSQSWSYVSQESSHNARESHSPQAPKRNSQWSGRDGGLNKLTTLAAMAYPVVVEKTQGR